ncbi:hypothetical protein Achl_4248 (plasmid) [Pseudarthrobacter chlorophenolicus A6]|uniref:Uncharacterized protein n=1 Tax=Pseudarthrobacter chlorophenolicus (strain ATCC 700700 / DSM 12829 / CIP 107037 / JCM 12360 / KCTC 9906 / NCIMB 13794 / A6) TaxID=452863 RepID=B8HIF2_PSECP|nr:hypothetical protein [Pseudarthrobacter chlorophenolicus]ACL42199.1 hypothetical protein Achl_4248 [Pseudarthrobacter chlorophenolicus A6]SDQ14736.1 hypothetical protein SAMN04489738_0306 [Pseudarthrobacter chlorophenolicus]
MPSPLNVQPPRPSTEFTIPLRPGEFFRVEDTRCPDDPYSRDEPQNFLTYHQAYEAAKGLGPHGTLGNITVMTPAPREEVTAANSNGFPVVMGTIPCWEPVSLLDRIKRKDTDG